MINKLSLDQAHFPNADLLGINFVRKDTGSNEEFITRSLLRNY